MAKEVDPLQKRTGRAMMLTTGLDHSAKIVAKTATLSTRSV